MPRTTRTPRTALATHARLLPVSLALASGAALLTATPALAGGGVTCSFTHSTTAAVSSVALPATVKAGSTVSGVVTIDRDAGDRGPVEVALSPSSWTRTNVCVIVSAGASSARFDVTVSPVTTEGHVARVSAYATADGADLQTTTAAITPDGD